MKYEFEKYEENGYINYESTMQLPADFFFLIGSRGTGKTFGGIKYPLVHNMQFVFMRRSAVEMDMLKKPDFMPFNPINDVLGRNIRVEPEGRYITNVLENNVKRGYMIALSNIAKLRGFNLSSIEYILYDEFIHEPHEKAMRNEAEAFFNAYETINRNRELEGAQPVKAVLCANSNNLQNDFFMYLNIADKFEKARKKGKNFFIEPERRLCVIDYSDSLISERKKETSLYKLTKGTNFRKMAIDNEFTDARVDKIKSMDISGYVLETKIGELFIYKHKSNKTYYVTRFEKGKAKENVDPRKEGRRYLLSNYMHYYNAFVNNRMLFENQLCLYLFENYYTGK